MMKLAIRLPLTLGVLAVGVALFSSFEIDLRGTDVEKTTDWRSDWAVEDGFAVSLDVEGFHLPTAIAFVPEPGTDPKAPLYFVTELRGKVKVVTNDRSVYTFAEDFFEFVPQEELPSGQGEGGMAGICLAPERGYVFVTFMYQDRNKVLRNNIVRFKSTPQTFSLKPTAQHAFTEIFRPYESGLAHQIGNCQVREDLLYVGIGEGWQPFRTQQLDHMQGKLIRMTLDGAPVPDNPFYEDDDVGKARNFVWAYGLRNPFGLELVQDQVFVADNGVGIDRFLKVRRGMNYLWDGSDASIATNADFIWSPSLAPVQMEHAGEVASFPEAYRNAFYVAVAGSRNKSHKKPGIMMLQYGVEEEALLSVPRYVVKYRGGDVQSLAGLAFGPDGLYFAPLFPDAQGHTPILKLTYDAAGAYPHTMAQSMTPLDLVKAKGCIGCHAIGGKWGYAGAVGPPLPRGMLLVKRITAKIASEGYADYLRTVDHLEAEPQASYRRARQEMLDADGVEKVRTWLKYYLQEPRFDRPYNSMPNLGLSEEEALAIADFLIDDPEAAISASLGGKVRKALAHLVPARAGRKLLIAYFMMGILMGGLLFVCLRRASSGS